jgi:hypothetical protein
MKIVSTLQVEEDDSDIRDHSIVGFSFIREFRCRDSCKESNRSSNCVVHKCHLRYGLSPFCMDVAKYTAEMNWVTHGCPICVC